MRSIAFSIIILSGSILVGLGAVSRISRGADAQGIGYFILLLGVVLLAFDLRITGFHKEVKKDIESWESLRSLGAAPRKTDDDNKQSK